MKYFTLSVTVFLGFISLTLLAVNQNVFGIAEFFVSKEETQNTKTPLEDQIEQWNLYKENPDGVVGTGDCGNKTIENFLHKINSGSRKEFNLNGAMRLVMTPNIENITNEQFQSMNSLDGAFCAVGGLYPLKAYPDKLLWYEGSCGGRIPDKFDPEYNLYQKCLDAERAIDLFLEKGSGTLFQI